MTDKRLHFEKTLAELKDDTNIDDDDYGDGDDPDL